MKEGWRKTLQNFKTANLRLKSVPKSQFPSLLKNAIVQMDTITVNKKEFQNRVSENLKSGFKSCGLVPYNPEAVLKKLPKRSAATEVNKILVDFLSEKRFSTRQVNALNRGRPKKVNITPGRRVVLVNETFVSPTDEFEDVDGDLLAVNSDGDLPAANSDGDLLAANSTATPTSDLQCAPVVDRDSVTPKSSSSTTAVPKRRLVKKNSPSVKASCSATTTVSKKCLAENSSRVKASCSKTSVLKQRLPKKSDFSTAKANSSKATIPKKRPSKSILVNEKNKRGKSDEEAECTLCHELFSRSKPEVNLYINILDEKSFS